MKRRHFCFFFFLVVGIFIVYSLARETIIDADSPAFLMYSCGQIPLGKFQEPIGRPLSVEFFQQIPCNMLVFKAVACAILFVCFLILAKTGELVSKNNGWMLGLFSCLNIYWITDLLKLEEMSFAYPLIFSGFYFLLKHIFRKKSLIPSIYDSDLLLATCFIGFAGLFWKGTIYYLIMLGFYWIWIGLFAIFFINKFWQQLFSPLIDGILSIYHNPNGKIVVENAPFVGFLHNWLLLFGLFGQTRALWPATLYTLGISVLAQKYVLFSVPFLGTGFLIFLENPLLWKKYFKEKFISNWYPVAIPFAITVAIGLLLFQIFMLFPSPIQLSPTNEEILAIKETVAIAKGEPILNNWGLGWWIKFYNGQTRYYSGFNPDLAIEPDFNNMKGIALTESDTNCTLLKQFQKLKIYRC